MINDLFSREVQKVFVAGYRRGETRALDGPAGVSAVEVGVLAYGFGLDPEAELKAEAVDLLGESLEAVGQLFPIDFVITKRGMVVVPTLEPAIVEDEELDDAASEPDADAEPEEELLLQPASRAAHREPASRTEIHFFMFQSPSISNYTHV